MCSHVPCEMTISWKRFVTVIAMKWLNWCFTSSTILHVFLIRGLVSVNFVTRLTLKHVTICVASWAILLVEVENDFEHWSQSLLFLWYWWMWELNCFLVLKAFSGPPDQTEFLLSMCPIVIFERKKEPILFKFFWFLATNIIKGQSAGGLSLHLEVRNKLNVSPNSYNTTNISVPTRKMVPIHK